MLSSASTNGTIFLPPKTGLTLSSVPHNILEKSNLRKKSFLCKAFQNETDSGRIINTTSLLSNLMLCAQKKRQVLSHLLFEF